MPLIPKLIHFCWIPSWKKAPSFAKQNLERWEFLNPEYEILTWSEADIVKLMPPSWRAAYASLDKYVKKADFARMVVLYNYGGCYFDADLFPFNSIRNLFDKKKLEVIDPKKDHKKLIWFPKRVKNTLDQKSLILTREWRSGSSVPYRIANGCVLSRAAHPAILEFILKSYKSTNNKVLWYMGPQAWSQHIRDNVEELKGSTAVLSPQHFLWEKGKAPKWTISKHLGIQSKDDHWGDHNKQDYWNV